MVRSGTDPARFDDPREFVTSFPLRPGWVVWCGSTISAACPSSLPRAAAVIEAMLIRLGQLSPVANPSSQALATWASKTLRWGGANDVASQTARIGGPPFEAILGQIAGFLEPLVKRYLGTLYPTKDLAVPNANHELILQLLGRADVAFGVTTNFDECLEAAGLHQSRIVVPVEGAFAPPAHGLLKIHGTSAQPDTVAATETGLSRRMHSVDWTDSLLSALAGRDVVFIGYGMRDWFDIHPVLVRAVREASCRLIYTARSAPTEPSPTPIAAFVESHLGTPQKSVLCALARQWPSQVGAIPTQMEELATASSALDVATRVTEISDGSSLAALAALLGRVERGEESLRLYGAARTEGEPSVDDALIAGALLRARRYRAAERRLVRVAAGAPDVAAALVALCGAGHVAQTGGRMKRSAAHYASAEKLFREHFTDDSRMTQRLADQFLRGRAENLIALALRSRDRPEREVLLGEAHSYAKRLEDYSTRVGLPVSLQLLVTMLRARLALADGDLEGARVILEDQLELPVREWADPLLRNVHSRLLAAAAPSLAPRLTREVIADSRQNRRWHEWAKAHANRLGVYGLGRWGPLQMRVRDALLSGWDYLKDTWAAAFRKWAH